MSVYEMSFKDKVALVTGAQQGIGRSIAKAFAEAGANVAINWLDDKSGAEGVAEFAQQFGVRTALIHGDVAKATGARKIVGEAINNFGAVDFLINNAGVFPRVPFLAMEEEDWDYVIDVNLRGSFFCAQAVVKTMIELDRPGCIINLASQAIGGFSPGSVHYTASKMGIVGMTRAIAFDVAKHGIRVNSIAPGLTDTAQPRFGNTESEIAEMAKKVPLGRLIQPEEIADMAVFLCSKYAKMVTGQTYHLNGGTYSPG